MLRTNPLMAGALAATVGSAVALALPETRREDQLLGKARDSVMGQAQEIKQETMEKVEQVVEGAKEEAQACPPLLPGNGGQAPALPSRCDRVVVQKAVGRLTARGLEMVHQAMLEANRLA
jgi:hypothetical protein